ncbi:hypothetical protein PR002_g27464 [Phytophthora rubi]|uniref:Uncharacterized protein n=1 Tax=Phytophthora rubi TaxID=129364 RepID=A0A6A3HLV7_9STRA|nr:hypothetical protein PR002_g27464 [Phytophthora rubi]
MQIRERFATKGYVVFEGAVHDDKINVWWLIARLWQSIARLCRSIARLIDGWFEEEVTDMTEEQVRVKAAVPGQDAREIPRSLERIYRMFYPAGSAQDWIFMKTPAGTKVQPPHRDVLTVPQGADIMDVSSLSGPIVVPHYDRPHDHRPTVVTEIDDTRGIDRPICIVENCTFEGTPLSLRRHLIRFHGIRFQRAARHLEP